MANPQTVRLDLLDSVEESVIEQRLRAALEVYPRFLVYCEVADETQKVHWQGIVWTDCPHKTYQGYMEKLFPEWKGTRGCKGQGKRSFAPVKKLEEYEVYVTKDKNRRIVQGYRDDELDALEAKSYKKSEKSRKVEKSSLQRLVDYIEEHQVDHLSPHAVGAAVIDYYVKQVKCEPNDFQLKCMIKSVIGNMMFRHQPKDYEKWRDARVKSIIGHEFIFPNDV